MFPYFSPLLWMFSTLFECFKITLCNLPFLLLKSFTCNWLANDCCLLSYLTFLLSSIYYFLVKFKSTFNEHGTIVLSLFCDRQITRFSFNLLKLTSLNLTFLTLTFKFLLPIKLPPCSSRTYYKLFVYLLLCTTKFSRVLISVTVCLPITNAWSE